MQGANGHSIRGRVRVNTGKTNRISPPTPATPPSSGVTIGRPGTGVHADDMLDGLDERSLRKAVRTTGNHAAYWQRTPHNSKAKSISARTVVAPRGPAGGEHAFFTYDEHPSYVAKPTHATHGEAKATARRRELIALIGAKVRRRRRLERVVALGGSSLNHPTPHVAASPPRLRARAAPHRAGR